MNSKKIILLIIALSIILLLIPFEVCANKLISSINIQSPVDQSSMNYNPANNYAVISWDQSEQIIINVFICNLNGLIVKTIYKYCATIILSG